jgi:hypothetical protein
MAWSLLFGGKHMNNLTRRPPIIYFEVIQAYGVNTSWLFCSDDSFLELGTDHFSKSLWRGARV